jgi:hypothetical protein
VDLRVIISGWGGGRKGNPYSFLLPNLESIVEMCVGEVKIDSHHTPPDGFQGPFRSEGIFSKRERLDYF